MPPSGIRTTEYATTPVPPARGSGRRASAPARAALPRSTATETTPIVTFLTMVRSLARVFPRMRGDARPRSLWLPCLVDRPRRRLPVSAALFRAAVSSALHVGDADACRRFALCRFRTRARDRPPGGGHGRFIKRKTEIRLKRVVADAQHA